MQLNLENHHPFTIQAYSENKIQINEIIYTNSIIVSPFGIISDWPIKHLEAFDPDSFLAQLPFKPEIILIGHAYLNQSIATQKLYQLLEKRIALECMSVGAACRTYNVLISEDRPVVLGVIKSPHPGPLP